MPPFPVLAVLIGCALVVVAILGGGVSIREITVPPLKPFPRVLIGALGAAFIVAPFLDPVAFQRIAGTSPPPPAGGDQARPAPSPSTASPPADAPPASAKPAPSQAATAISAGAAEQGAPATPGVAPVALNAPATALTPQTAAMRAVAYLAAWSSPDDPTGEAIRPFYAPIVRFYGADVSLEQVMADKHAFAARWPARRYAPRPESLAVQCADEHTCQVNGVLDWEAADVAAGRRSVGVATFAMTFRDGLIAGESGTVLSRE